jgi:hypothetical protein
LFEVSSITTTTLKELVLLIDSEQQVIQEEENLLEQVTKVQFLKKQRPLQTTIGLPLSQS